MRVLMAAAELAPVARVGGMAEAVAGLVHQLRADGHEVRMVLPDYGGVQLVDETIEELDVPAWAHPMSARTGTLAGHGPLTLVNGPGISKPHPYNDAWGQAFPDNDVRFFAFSAGIAALTKAWNPDVVHLNDWHTAATLGLMADPPPSVVTIHTLAYQGVSGPGWMERLVRQPGEFEWYGATNPLLGGIKLADRVVTVSPNYASEILSEQYGMGLHEVLAGLGDRLVGIINGIDTAEWNPASDETIPAVFNHSNLRGKAVNRTALHHRFGLPVDEPPQPLVAMVTRLVEQKGIDLAADAARFLDRIPARLAVLGSGDAHLADHLASLSQAQPDRIGFINGYDADLSHLIFAGADLLLMPSRFEPCGLAQMQAMAYGTIPIVTGVGGLVDTVVDADDDPDNGTGFVARSADSAGIVDAVHRAARAWAASRRCSAIRRRGMRIDWSWTGPAQSYVDLYRSIV